MAGKQAQFAVVTIPFLIGNTAGKERADMIWEQFAAAAPEMAALGRTQFEQSGVALLGTLRKDGSPASVVWNPASWTASST